MSKTVVYEYSRILLIVILLLYFSGRTVGFGFPLGSWPILSQFLVAQHAQWVPSQGVVLNQIRYWLVTPKVNAIIALAYLAGRIPL